MKRKPNPYLANRDLLAEIHKSKLTYCSFVDPLHGAFDAIVSDVSEITRDLIEATRLKRAKLTGEDPESIPLMTLVFRVMTDAHIPRVEYWPAKAKMQGRGKARVPVPPQMIPAKTCFPPFIHVVMAPEGPTEVLRSHWKGGLSNGHFSNDHGRLTDRLGIAFMMLVKRYGSRPNWRDYSYRDEMEASGIVQLASAALRFNEAKSDNPFAFYTTTVHHAFLKVLNAEKRVQNTRDDLLQEAGVMPSMTRQLRDL